MGIDSCKSRAVRADAIQKKEFGCSRKSVMPLGNDPPDKNIVSVNKFRVPKSCPSAFPCFWGIGSVPNDIKLLCVGFHYKKHVVDSKIRWGKVFKGDVIVVTFPK